MQICMDWRSVKFDWNRARAFLVTAEEGSLSAAARALGLSQPTLGRQVAALEEELGLVLFERIGRRLQLTPSGLELAEHVRAMGEAATRISLAASGQSTTLAGTIRITATEVFAAIVLPGLLDRLRREHPAISAEIVASNDLSDLRRREADIAIRHAEPSDPDLIARRLRDQTAHLYAATSYLSLLGEPRAAMDLADATFIGFDNDSDERYLKGLRAKGLPVMPGHFRLRTDNHLVQWEMVKRGLGIGVMASLVGESEPAVARAAPWIEPFTFPVWLVAHRELRTSPRVRLVFDLLAEEISRA